MRRQREGARAPACALVGRAGDAEQLLGLTIPGLELRIAERPVSRHAEARAHAERFWVKAMGLAGEMQRGAAHAAHVLIADHLPGALAVGNSRHPGPGSQRGLLADERLIQ